MFRSRRSMTGFRWLASTLALSKELRRCDP
jgi:hypothetical protein